MITNRQLQTILALDTSCDETSAAVTSGDRVLSNIVASQIDLHREFGGVVPSIAKRAHQELLGPTIEKALKEAKVDPDRLDAVAVTIGPGLAIALEVGVYQAKELAKKHKKLLIAIDHMEGHLLSPFSRDSKGELGIDDPKFPALGLLVSGGHTELVLMGDFGEYEIVGRTLDDAAGECFDKVARMLGLGYPGGPAISRLAKDGDEDVFDLPVPMQDSEDLNFSFSGLKTACLYQLKELGKLNRRQTANFCASFERVAVTHLVNKLILACRKFKPKMILLGGGVIANQRLQKEAREEMGRLGIPVYAPFTEKLLTDNAAMIGVAAFYKAERGGFVEDIDKLERVPDLSLGLGE